MVKILFLVKNGQKGCHSCVKSEHVLCGKFCIFILTSPLTVFGPLVLKQSRAHPVPPDDSLTTLDGRRPLIENNLKNEDDLKKEDNLKKEDDIKNEGDL